MGLLPSNADVKGEVLLDGRELNGLPNDELRKIRGNDIAMVFQDALSALNPYYSVGWQVAEAYRLHHDVSKKVARRAGGRDARPGRHPGRDPPRRQATRTSSPGECGSGS